MQTMDSKMVSVNFGALLLFTSVMLLQGQNSSSQGLGFILSAFAPLLNPLTLWDGPTWVSQASTTTTTTQATLADIQYYNYFVASIYCGQAQLEDFSCHYCDKFSQNISSITIINNATYGTWGMITVDPIREEIVVAFRGSDATFNWILDAVLFQIDFAQNIRVHQGNYISTMSLLPQAVAIVRYLLVDNPGFKVVLVGHSLGGAMADIGQMIISYLDLLPGVTTSLYTYGMPRSGNKGFADFMNQLNITSARVTSRADLIPHIYPVWSGLLSLQGQYYVHHHNEFWAYAPGSVVGTFCSTTKYEDPTCSNSKGPAYIPLDHIMYLDVNYGICYFDFNNFFAAYSQIPFVPQITPVTAVVPQFPPEIRNYCDYLTSVVFSTAVGLFD